MNRRSDDKELCSANAGFSLKYLIVREQKRIGHAMAASSYHSMLPEKKSLCIRYAPNAAGLFYMRLSPLHISHIDIAAEEGCSTGNHCADVADVGEVAVPRRDPAEVRSAAEAEVEDARVDRRCDG